MKNLILIFSFILISISTYTQSDTLFDEFKKEFEEFYKSTEEEFNQYLSKNDSAFLDFLERAWKEYEVFKQEHLIRPKPDIQPIIKTLDDTLIKSIQLIKLESVITLKEDSIIPLIESKQDTFYSRTIKKEFAFYGTKLSIIYYPDQLPKLETINDKSITEFYKRLALNHRIWDYKIVEFNKIIENLHFNDWGYYQLLSEAASSIFQNPEEQVLFTWYALVNSGYIAKVGYNNNHLFLMLPAQQELFNILYFSENGLKYYLVNQNENQVNQLRTYPGIFKGGTKIFSYALNELPKINNTKFESRQLDYINKNVDLKFKSELIQFLNSFPQCSMHTFFNTPVSNLNLHALDNVFIPLLVDLSNREKIDILLDFIQNSIDYKIDQEQFGKERFMFAEECLYYPYSDCEDRTVLLSQLVKHYTDLPTIGLEYKDHVTLAVQIPGESSGYYVFYEGKKYFVCDPTYINAKSGMIPEDLKNEEPKIITF